MKLQIGQTVVLKRNIYRLQTNSTCHILYGQKGDVGQVVETFSVYKSPTESTWYTKVHMGSEVKTFRLTSLAAHGLVPKPLASAKPRFLNRRRAGVRVKAY